MQIQHHFGSQTWATIQASDVGSVKGVENRLREELLCLGRAAARSVLGPGTELILTSALMSIKLLVEQMARRYAALAPEEMEGLQIRLERVDPQREADNRLPPEVVRVTLRRRSAEGDLVGPALVVAGLVGHQGEQETAQIEVRLEFAEPSMIQAFSDAVVRYADLVDEVCSYGQLRGMRDDPAGSSGGPRSPAAFIEARRWELINEGEDSEGLILVVEDARDLWVTGLAAIALLEFNHAWMERRQRPDLRLAAVRDLLKARALLCRPAASNVTPLDLRRSQASGRVGA